jgi:DNA-damage-inducible protein J
MAKTETIRARVDAKLKAQAEGVLEKLGLNASEAIRLFYKQVALRKGLPFEVRIPNAETRRALREANAGKDLTAYENADAMFDDILGEGWRNQGPR